MSVVTPLTTIRDSTLLSGVTTTVYTAPATAGGGNITEQFMLDLVLTNILPSGAEVKVDVIVNDGTNKYLARELPVGGVNLTSNSNIWNNGSTVTADPKRLPFKISALSVGDTVQILPTTDEIHAIPVLSVTGTVHVLNDL